jgi:hypothetical protein
MNDDNQTSEPQRPLLPTKVSYAIRIDVPSDAEKGPQWLKDFRVDDSGVGICATRTKGADLTNPKPSIDALAITPTPESLAFMEAIVNLLRTSDALSRAQGCEVLERSYAVVESAPEITDKMREDHAAGRGPFGAPNDEMLAQLAELLGMSPDAVKMSMLGNRE